MFKKQKEQYEVEGFLFASEAEAEQAKKEREGVKYIRSRVDMDHPEQVLKIYNRMKIRYEDSFYSTKVSDKIKDIT